MAAAIGDRSRAAVLIALAGGGAMPASALAAEAGVSASTISGHLNRLREAKLLTVEHDGRHRYYRLASTDVARALEELARIARPLPVSSLRASAQEKALLRARLCYDHLAGRLGVALLAAQVNGGLLDYADGSYRITPAGAAVLDGLGIDVTAFPRRRAAIRYCVDWAEDRHHLAGTLGSVITSRLFELDWLRRGRGRRVVQLTDTGTTGLREAFGLPADRACDRAGIGESCLSSEQLSPISARAPRPGPPQRIVAGTKPGLAPAHPAEAVRTIPAIGSRTSPSPSARDPATGTPQARIVPP